MKWAILYFKGSHVQISIKLCISVSEDCFILANCADPDEIPPAALFIFFAKVPVYQYP